MDDEDDNPPARKYPMSASKMSKTPSWIMLGFVLGALASAAFLQRPAKNVAPPSPAPVAVPAEPEKPRVPQPLSKIEIVFEMYGKEALWDRYETTEVALFDGETKDFYEVRRMEGKLYFRTIPELTRRVLVTDKTDPANPLQFTETEEQYAERMERHRRLNPMSVMWEKKKEQPPPPKTTLPGPSLPANSSVRVPSAPPIEPLPRPTPGQGK